MTRGRVKWFSGEKGFGFLEAETGEDLLVHFDEISGEGFRSLQADSQVEFEVYRDARGRPFAANVKTLDEDGNNPAKPA